MFVFFKVLFCKLIKLTKLVYHQVVFSIMMYKNLSSLKWLGLNLVVSAILINLLQGCATLNKSECQSADWQIIGLEDGASGKPSSYIGEHRSACAEYQVKPNLALYLKGHQQGVVQFCTYDNGLHLGEQGSRLNSVCQGELLHAFKLGHEKGKALYHLSKQLKGLQKDEEDIDAEYHLVVAQIKSDEELLISDNISKERRRELLRNIKKLTRTKRKLQDEIHYIQQQIESISDAYEHLKHQQR